MQQARQPKAVTAQGSPTCPASILVPTMHVRTCPQPPGRHKLHVRHKGFFDNAFSYPNIYTKLRGYVWIPEELEEQAVIVAE